MCEDIGEKSGCGSGYKGTPVTIQGLKCYKDCECDLTYFHCDYLVALSSELSSIANNTSYGIKIKGRSPCAVCYEECNSYSSQCTRG